MIQALQQERLEQVGNHVTQTIMAGIKRQFKQAHKSVEQKKMRKLIATGLKDVYEGNAILSDVKKKI